MRTNTVELNFPGYMPIQLLFSVLARCGLTPFGAMWLVSLTFGMGSVIYVALAARREAGPAFSLMAAVVMSFGILPLYFSVVGATYAADMLCASAMVFHGSIFLENRKTRVTLPWPGSVLES